MAGQSTTMWHMLVVDDFLWESGGREYRFAIMSFFIIACVLGVPLGGNAGMGWFRAVTGVLQGRHIPTQSRVVRALGNRNSRNPNRSYEDFRGVARSY